MECGQRRESHLEKFIVDFVLEKVTEHVRLQLTDVITVLPSNLRRKAGAHLLAIFWANVLQHELNFPPASHRYRRRQVAEDGRTGELLELTLDDEGVQVLVDMTAGTLTIGGQYVYDWFTTKFKQILANFDAQFAARWVFVPTSVGDLPHAEDVRRHEYQKTDTEAYLLLEGRGQQRLDKQLEEKLQLEDLRQFSVIEDPSINKSLPCWSANEIDNQLKMLSQGGGIFDGFSFIYALWRSVLRRWFNQADAASVYVASPLLDAHRLCDIIDICSQCRDSSDVKLAALYVAFQCGGPDGAAADFGTVSRDALRRYDSASQRADAEYRVLRQVAHPLRRRFNVSFVARVPAGGGASSDAEIIVTSAAFHSRDFHPETMASVFYAKLSKDVFIERYIRPLEVPAVTGAVLPS